MFKEIHPSAYFLVTFLCLAVLTFIYNDFICSGSKCYEMEVSFFEPLFFATVGIIPTLVFLLFFPKKIFFLWLKYFAWWFMIIVMLFVMRTYNENDFSPFANDVFNVNLSMAILFIITFIYALIMNNLRKNTLLPPKKDKR